MPQNARDGWSQWLTQRVPLTSPLLRQRQQLCQLLARSLGIQDRKCRGLLALAEDL